METGAIHHWNTAEAGTSLLFDIPILYLSVKRPKMKSVDAFDTHTVRTRPQRADSITPFIVLTAIELYACYCQIMDERYHRSTMRIIRLT
jgi:hypothetical protein